MVSAAVGDPVLAGSLAEDENKLVHPPKFDYPDHILPVRDMLDLRNVARDPSLNAFPLLERDPYEEEAVQVILQAMKQNPIGNVGSIVPGVHISIDYLPALLDQGVRSFPWYDEVRPEWEIVRDALVERTIELCGGRRDSHAFVALGVGAERGKRTHCDPGALIYVDPLGSTLTVGYENKDVSLRQLPLSRGGQAWVPDIADGAELIRLRGKAAFMKGYGDNGGSAEHIERYGLPFTHNAPDPQDQLQPYSESSRLVFMSASMSWPKG